MNAEKNFFEEEKEKKPVRGSVSESNDKLGAEKKNGSNHCCTST